MTDNSMEQKEFGKLTLDQFRRTVQCLPELRGQMDELPKLIRSKPKEKLAEILDRDFYWAKVYELTFPEQLAWLIFVLGKANEIMEALKQEDPQEYILSTFDTDSEEEWARGEGGQFQKKHLVGMVTALQKSILSIMLYHCPLNTLVEQVRANGEDADDAFFKAVRVDRSILACPTFADRLAKAELENDWTFFLHLKSALKGPSKKHWESFKDLRYALYMLRDLGFNQMSDERLEDLLVHKLKLYPNAPSARKNLRKQFTESKRLQPPQTTISGGRLKVR